MFLGLPFALAGIAAVCGISFLTVRHSVLTFLGSISYSLYLVHPPIGKIVFTLGRRFATSESAKVAITFAALGLAILAAYLLYVVVEGPSQRWSSSFKYKRPVAGEPESYVADINSSATEELAIP